MDDKIISHSRALLQECDAVLIGAGSGLSTAAGLEYGGERFQRHFPDYIAKYGMTDMYSAGFYPFASLQDKWGFRSRQVKLNRYDAKVGDVYLKLLDLVRHKPYFIITTNVDAQFERAGFDKRNIFAVQGDYGKFQCTVPCHNKLYDNESQISAMAAQQADCQIPSELVPYCPNCGEPMMLHVRIDNTFVENSNWHAAKQGYSEFLGQFHNQKLLLLELGVGFNTPTIIRFPFEQFSRQFPHTHLIRLNKDDARSQDKLKAHNLLVEDDICQWLNKLAEI
ncbi:Sir2 silent information regulator family NAD-dependent deacetylase [Shewanella canadensis]|uniref:Sir2 silent information regulator family NAD-dependent deacetylase n=1 Tax=Shewanella canadensis TaxID=271096 RepID=A0A431WYJ2_9GAMM|nr:Sir2 family NAD-dependent protein deacetylase [Shewanella canadensis]RTR40564.1 Sir2 silent information regulator family NAD-dependent deacetylase [Shewanella canadensis]